jgi:hypothetical protein
MLFRDVTKSYRAQGALLQERPRLYTAVASTRAAKRRA